MVLDDEPLIASDIAIALEDAGAHVVGPVRSAPDAIREIEGAEAEVPIDGAILDVNLGDHDCSSVAETLSKLRVPFVFHTGNQIKLAGVLEQYSAPVVRKPAQPKTLLAALASRFE